MGGFSSERRSRYKAYNEVYGYCYIPTSFAANTVLGSPENNVCPEMFYGFYTSDIGEGIDIGLVYRQNVWVISSYTSEQVVYPGDNPWHDVRVENGLILTPGGKYYTRAWISKEGSYYYANYNISTTGYRDTDLLATPYKRKINTSMGEDWYENGASINREIVIASNNSLESHYTNSGCYSYGGKWGVCGLKKYRITNGIEETVTNVAWTDDLSLDWRGTPREQYEKFKMDSSNTRKILRLRQDPHKVNNKWINYYVDKNETTGATEIRITSSTTNTASGATETTNINCTPM